MHNVVVRDIPCCARSDMSASAYVKDVGRCLAPAGKNKAKNGSRRALFHEYDKKSQKSPRKREKMLQK